MRILVVAALFFVVLTVAHGQNDVDLQEQIDALSTPPPNGIIAGPFGEPRMVMSEGGQWSYPINVFAGEKVEAFIPDITSPSWVQWHAAEFRKNGTYFTYIYLYSRSTRNTQRELVYVDTRANTATVEQEFLPPVHVDIPKAPLSFSKSIEKTTAIVKDEISRFRGQTIQDVIEAQKPMVARMAHQIEAPNDSPPPPSGSLSTIQPPQLLSSVSPVYPDEARRVKMSGVVKLTLTIDVYGRPRNIEIIQHQGMGLDQAAVKAVSQYRFTPAIDMAKGIAIPMKLITDVVFKLY